MHFRSQAACLARTHCTYPVPPTCVHWHPVINRMHRYHATYLQYWQGTRFGRVVRQLKFGELS